MTSSPRDAVSGRKRQAGVPRTPDSITGGYCNLGNLPGPSGGERIDSPSSRKKASRFQQLECPPNLLPAQVRYASPHPGDGALVPTGQGCRGRSLPSQGYSPEGRPTASSQPAGAWHSGSSQKGTACPLALGRGGARRGGQRKSRSGARAPGQPAEAGLSAIPEKTRPEGRAERGRAVVWQSQPNRWLQTARPTHAPAPARPGRQPKRRSRTGFPGRGRGAAGKARRLTARLKLLFPLASRFCQARCWCR
uniref:uncharacterized protein LOC114674977 n=1 Tax=Macaca mulatta TaxID=9544 RepID=UPI0010A26684|nr:uncharacterized protein LOC114674977 [Macaca mulatta]